MAGTRQVVGRVLGSVLRIAAKGASQALRSSRRRSQQASRPDHSGNHKRNGSNDGGHGSDYPGDFTGVPPMTYAPRDDGQPDPGEVVWGWVPYEEDHSQGKDRPVLVIGHHDHRLLALQLTSQDHDRDEAQEASAGRFWVDIGTGDWDSRGRASEVRTNRILQLDPSAIRREGGRIAEDVFDRVAAEVRRRN